MTHASAWRRLRVALVAVSADDTVRGGGTERACAELLRRACADIDFVVVSGDLPPDLFGLVRWRRVPLPRGPAALRDIVFFALAGWRLRTVDVDLVHETGAIVPNRVMMSSVHFCHVAFRAKNVKRVASGATLTRRLGAEMHRRFAEAAERWVYRPERVACLAAVSPGVAAELREHFDVSDVVVVPNGVDVERFRPDPAARRTLRAEVGVDEAEVVGLFVGGDWTRKRLELVVRAVARARAERLPISLWVVGRGDERAYSALAASCGVADAVRFFGRRADTERFYAAADVFVLPSSYETFSLVAYEAASAGLPVIGTSVSGVAELILEGGGGRIVDPELGALFEALRDLATDCEERARLGASARSWAERFAWDRSVAATLDAYERLSASGVSARE